MSKLKEQLQDTLKAAMRAKDNERRNAIRLLQSAIKQVEVDERETLDDARILDILQREAKKRRETIEELERAGRADEAAKERTELSVTEEFLPRQLTIDELRPLVQETIVEIGATSMKDMSQVMKTVMPRVKGFAEGKAVSALVRELLS